MALITRLSRLFRADFHAVIDQLEEPDIVLRQAVREMEESVAKGDFSMTKITQESKQHEQTLATISRTLEQTEEELDICFASGKDALSKGLIKRKLEGENRKIRLETHLGQLNQRLKELNNQQTERKSILESMQQKVSLLTENPSQSSYSTTPSSEALVTEADIEIAFLKEQQKRSLP